MTPTIARRSFIAALGGAAVWPLAASAQQGDRVRRIGVFAKTIGIVRVSRWTATVAEVPFARMMSGCRRTNSCASTGIRLMS
jgi:hypothetical protein